MPSLRPIVIYISTLSGIKLNEEILTPKDRGELNLLVRERNSEGCIALYISPNIQHIYVCVALRGTCEVPSGSDLYLTKINKYFSSQSDSNLLKD